jgi:hypothetical protein
VTAVWRRPTPRRSPARRRRSRSSRSRRSTRVRPDALETPAETVPERLLAFFSTNRERLEAAAAVHAVADLDPAADLDALADALDRLGDDGTIAGDAELDRLTAAVDDLDAAVATAESVADDHLRGVIRERDVTIEGTDFLSLVEQGRCSTASSPTSTRPPLRRRVSTSSTRSDSTPRRPNSPAASSVATPRSRSSTPRRPFRGSEPN